MLTEPSHAILVVDDDKDVREVLREVLVDDGCSVVTAGDGHEALEVLDRIPREPCLVLLDLMMPGMNGLAFLEELEKRHQRLPIVIMSAHSTADAGGVRRVLRKPPALEAILLAIRECCSHARP
jgi:two-component system nitrogen regulation response regulator GlnG